MMQLVEEVNTLIYTLIYTLLLLQYNIRTSYALSAASFILIFFFLCFLWQSKDAGIRALVMLDEQGGNQSSSFRPVLLRLPLSGRPLEKKDLPVFKAVIETTLKKNEHSSHQF